MGFRAEARIVMCGRFNQHVNPREWAEAFAILRGFSDTWTPSYNIAPTQKVLAVRDRDQREFFSPKWGLIPSWAKDAKIGASCINARAETIESKPAFRTAFKKRRCLVMADGFYEWQKDTPAKGEKRPYYISLRSGQPMAFAGLWETWNSPDGPIETCTICTTDANDLMGRIHDRMPVILPRHMIDLWLDPKMTEPEELKPILQQLPSEHMQSWAVGKAVGNVRNQGPELMEPIGPPEPLDFPHAQ